jgi:hypothetical protein
VDKPEQILHIASNNGMSSSIFDLSEHDEIRMPSVRLDSLVEQERLDLRKYN